MKENLIFLLSVFFVLNISLVSSQSIDKTFLEPRPLRSAKIQCIKVLPDNKILLGGDIAFYKSKRVNNLIKLNANQSIDETFSFEGDNSLLIKEIEVQSTGDILVLAQGYSSLVNMYKSNYSLFLLDPNGKIKKQIDTLFKINSIALHNDDRVFVCGEKNAYGYLYKFNRDLSLDRTFNNSHSFNSGVTDVVIFKNTVLVSGSFSLVNNSSKNDLVRLDINGVIDPTFNTGSGTPDHIGSLAVQPDGKILLGRSYINSFDGVPFKGIARLNSDGSVDNSFICMHFNGPTSNIYVKDSFIYLSSYLYLNSEYGDYFLRLKSNGYIDESFTPIRLDDFGAYDFCLGLKDNTLFFNNSALAGNKYGLSSCDSAGKINKVFVPEVSRYGIIKVGDYFNGKLIIAGDFIKIGSVETYGISMLNKFGVVDTSFTLKKNLGAVIQVKVINDSSILVSTEKEFFKLNKKAEFQADFKYKPFKVLYQVLKFIVLKDGKIIAGDANDVYRLNADGTEDITYNPGSGKDAVSTAFDFDVQSGKVIQGSAFTMYNGTIVNKLIRLNTNGSIDNSFKIGTGPSCPDFKGITMIKVLDNEEVLVGGEFMSFNGMETPNRIVKLSKDGAVDSTFWQNQKKARFGSYLPIYNCKVEQIGSKIFIRNNYSIVVVNINGTIDFGFSIPVAINQVNDIVASKENSLKKSGLADDLQANLFAIGSFTQPATNEPSFILKLLIDNSATTSTDSKEVDSDFQLYPNPVIDKMYITTQKPYNNSFITIYSLNGVQLGTSVMKDNQVEIDMSKYVPGFYFVKISLPDGESVTRKILKQ